jgi:hypothetical protein
MTESTGVEAIPSSGYPISGRHRVFQVEVANKHITSALGDALVVGQRRWRPTAIPQACRATRLAARASDGQASHKVLLLS